MVLGGKQVDLLRVEVPHPLCSTATSRLPLAMMRLRSAPARHRVTRGGRGCASWTTRERGQALGHQRGHDGGVLSSPPVRHHARGDRPHDAEVDEGRPFERVRRDPEEHLEGALVARVPLPAPRRRATRAAKMGRLVLRMGL